MFEGFESYTGQAAGLATSVLWTGTSICFAAAGRRLGPVVVNGLRIAFAIVLLGLTYRLIAGQWIPDAVGGQVAYLALSGLVGLTIGDQALITAFVIIGPRLGMLIMATAPLWAALFGWMALGETIRGLSWLGIVLTIGGVSWVVLERPSQAAAPGYSNRTRGIVLAFIAAACQAGGLLLSKQGMGHGWLPADQHLPAQTATLIRMVFAGLGMIPILYWYRWRERKLRERGIMPTRTGGVRIGVMFTFFGAIFGPFLGVWMSLVATDLAPVGVAQTLCSLTPVFILPFALWIEKERIGLRAVLGAGVAVAGCAVLFLVRP